MQAQNLPELVNDVKKAKRLPVVPNLKPEQKPIVSHYEVYLEKNMVVSGKNQTDIMHDTLSFIKVNGEWKLMNIKGIKEGANTNE